VAVQVGIVARATRHMAQSAIQIDDARKHHGDIDGYSIGTNEQWLTKN
jgi:hypothetical protein